MTRRWMVLLLFLALGTWAFGQRGRAFVSIEAHVGTARSVHIGFVKHLEPIEYVKPKEGFYPGNPHRVTFTVTETIKGSAVKSLDLILTLQQTHELEYLRDNAIEVMLVATSQYIDEEAEIGLDGPGSRYSFRILQPIRHPRGKPESEWIAKQLNISLDEGRMFDLRLDVISRRDEILKRARAFAEKHPEVLHAHSIHVPNEFGVKCGYTNAYCGITLPLCPESEKFAIQLEKNPSRLLKDVKENVEYQRKAVIEGLRRFLSQFDAASDGEEHR